MDPTEMEKVTDGVAHALPVLPGLPGPGLGKGLALHTATKSHSRDLE